MSSEPGAGQLSKLIRTERQAAQLREWILTYERYAKEGSYPDLDRMLCWARDRLSVLDAILDPPKLASELRARKLFPEIDELHDPLGEPPAERRWW